MAKTLKAPAGYTSASTEIVGFYSEKLQPQIHFVPQSVTLSDSKIDAGKVKIYILGTLIDACTLARKGDETYEGQPGECVAVEYRAGMADIKNLAGQKVFMFPNGERKIPGRLKAMKVYEILRAGLGNPLRVSGDFRKKTRGVETPFTKTAAPAEVEADPFDDADELS